MKKGKEFQVWLLDSGFSVCLDKHISEFNYTEDDMYKVFIKMKAELIISNQLLERIFKYHISIGFGDDGSFDSFADEITDIL